jgi:hypothetical protein
LLRARLIGPDQLISTCYGTDEISTRPPYSQDLARHCRVREHGRTFTAAVWCVRVPVPRLINGGIIGYFVLVQLFHVFRINLKFRFYLNVLRALLWFTCMAVFFFCDVPNAECKSDSVIQG